MDKKVLGRKEALSNPWKGYRAPRTWGRWFAIQWPDVHPVTHCEAGKYTPDEETEICTSCDWIPATAVCPVHCKPLRDCIELTAIEVLAKHSHFDNKRALVIAYQAYVDKHRKELIGPPEFEVVAGWWNKSSNKTKNEFKNKYYDPDPDLRGLLRELAKLL